MLWFCCRWATLSSTLKCVTPSWRDTTFMCKPSTTLLCLEAKSCSAWLHLPIMTLPWWSTLLVSGSIVTNIRSSPNQLSGDVRQRRDLWLLLVNLCILYAYMCVCASTHQHKNDNIDQTTNLKTLTFACSFQQRENEMSRQRSERL